MLSLNGSCMRLVLYTKPGCHLCEGLQEKLMEIVERGIFAGLELEVRDITSRADWFEVYQYEVPVVFLLNRRGTESAEKREELLPRVSPRATVQQLEQLLRKYV